MLLVAQTMIPVYMSTSYMVDSKKGPFLFLKILAHLHVYIFWQKKDGPKNLKIISKYDTSLRVYNLHGYFRKRVHFYLKNSSPSTSLRFWQKKEMVQKIWISAQNMIPVYMSTCYMVDSEKGPFFFIEKSKLVYTSTFFDKKKDGSKNLKIISKHDTSLHVNKLHG